MKIKKIIGWTAFGIGAFLIVIIGVIALSIIFGVTINLDGLRGQVHEAATRVVGRETSIEGSINLVVSFQPSLEIKGFRMANPDNWEPGNFVRVDLVRAQVDILPLFKGKMQIGEIAAEGVTLNLVTKTNGDNNWNFDRFDSSSKESNESTDGRGMPAIDLVEVRKLVLNQVAVIYKDGGLDRTYRFKLDALDGTAATGGAAYGHHEGDFSKGRIQFHPQSRSACAPNGSEENPGLGT